MKEYDCWFQDGWKPYTDIKREVFERVWSEETGAVFENALAEYCRGVRRFGIDAVCGKGAAGGGGAAQSGAASAGVAAQAGKAVSVGGATQAGEAASAGVAAQAGKAVSASVVAQAGEAVSVGGAAQSGVMALSGVIIGTIPRLNTAGGFSIPPQRAEGFVIRAAGDRVVIAGQDERGALYGVYHFLGLLALGKVRAGLEIAESPAASLRMINHWDNLDGSIERGYAGGSLFFKDNRVCYDKRRVTDYARLLASVGINCLSINNVNVRAAAKLLISEEYLPDVAALAALFRPFGIRLLLSINFSAPYSLGKLGTADPLDERVADWWKKRADIIYQYIPDLAGFLVKADSEGEPGPFQYGRTHADGANMLACALSAHKGIVVWRCFVYNSSQDWRDTSVDRARSSFDHFKPLDGSFADNVLLQIKFGPYDFQVREPVSPLFGALKKTRHIMELQITQEYTGHQIDLCFLPHLWQDIMAFDTGYGNAAAGEAAQGDRIGDMVGASIEGLAAVGNVGLDQNWTGHTLAQANLYGYGRLAWNPRLSAAALADEWAALTFGAGGAVSDTASSRFKTQSVSDTVTASNRVSDTVKDLLLKSYPAYEKYNAPFGVCFMVTPGLHYGPSVEGYEFSRWGTYHRASNTAIGIDRTSAGTGYTGQYSPKNAALFGDPAQCPENLILFFHRLPYDFRMKNGETLLQNIYNSHFEGYDEVKAMLDAWASLKDALDAEVYQSVLSRFERQLANAREWRDQINTYFRRRTGIGDKRGRKIYE
jgi:alpha-glucuronidase